MALWLQFLLACARWGYRSAWRWFFEERMPLSKLFLVARATKIPISDNLECEILRLFIVDPASAFEKKKCTIFLCYFILWLSFTIVFDVFLLRFIYYSDDLFCVVRQSFSQQRKAIDLIRRGENICRMRYEEQSILSIGNLSQKGLHSRRTNLFKKYIVYAQATQN